VKPVALAFLWHLHQPPYRLRGERACVLPWVRLHAIRSYYDMVRILEEFPDVRVTINLTPVLVEQIGAYVAGGSDLFWETGAVPAADLEPAQRIFMFDHFFSAQETQMIGGLPRYVDLKARRDRALRLRGPAEAWREFGDDDYQDLQACFDLCWFGFKARDDFPELRALRERGQRFRPEDIRAIHDLEREILRRLLPLYRAAAARGQIEIATSPYAHPILPLLIDTDAAREAMPAAPLPARFRAPEDARAQVEEALRFIEQELGVRPKGMWPSEGSVGREAVALLSACGVDWAATDEQVLQASERDGPADAGRAWEVAGAGATALLFRDHELSDRIGFTYARMDPAAAARELLAAALERRRGAEAGRRIVLLALDGENPWDQYPRAGADFLRALYGGALRTAGVQCMTVGAALETSPRRGTIRRLRAGSWINADFGTWIGGPEKNRAWDVLAAVRGRLESALRGQGSIGAGPGVAAGAAARREAWASLRAAEGSDWFWWLDGQHDSIYRAQFDAAFRGHLRQACEAMGEPVPDVLDWPIAPSGAVPEGTVAESAGWLNVRVDGYENDFFEWRGAVVLGWTALDVPATMRRAWRGIETLRYGFSRAGELLLRLDPDRREGPGGFAGLGLELAFRSGERTRQLNLVLDERGDLKEGAPAGVRVAARKILELSVACEAIALVPGRAAGLLIRLRTAKGEFPLREMALRVPTFPSAPAGAVDARSVRG
jgi:alpha-amylase/alpha-mannosidase (GH57 family)